MFCTLENVQGRKRATTEPLSATKGQVGRIAGGNHHPFTKLTETLEVKELERNRETVQNFQEAGTSLEEEFHGYFFACDISIISRQIVSNLILEPLHY